MATMNIATKTLKLPFLGLNKSKRDEFSRLQKLNTETANAIVAMSKSERRTLTTKSFHHVELGSAWMNQTIRNANAKTKVKQFKCLPLETNNQNWNIQKVGETYSLLFGLVRGVKKRLPIEVHEASHKEWLDALIEGKAKAGSIKLYQSRKGIWYACLSVSMEVPETKDTGRWIGIDRGQNIPAAVATADGHIVFFKLARIRHIRRTFAERRKKLQKAGKHRAIKKLENRERRIVSHINHIVSKDIVAIAERQKAGIRLEDLSGIRKNAKQRKNTKSDAGQNRDYWPFYQLERFINYKAEHKGLLVEKVPPAYTSKSCHKCGHTNARQKHSYVCKHCGHKAHADGNAAMNIRDYVGLCCPLVL